LLAAGALLLASPANADFIITGAYEDPPAPFLYDEDELRATVTCSGCEILDYNGGDIVDTTTRPNSADADDFDAAAGNFFINEFGGNPEDEQDWVNAVLAAIGSSDTVDLGTKTEDPLNENNQFCSDAEYILLKVGQDPQYSLIHNTSGTEQCFTYLAEEGTGSGLSHIVEYGGNGEVSEPSILALFGLGLVMLGFLRRRTIV
jgi:hypothetical protein